MPEGQREPECCEHGRLLMCWCDQCYDWAEWIMQAAKEPR